MSSELKELLNAVADENCRREKTEFMAGIDRYKAILQQIVSEKKLDVTVTVEGIEHPSKLADDMVVLEKAHLVTGKTKYTHRNAYHEYLLTPKGAELAEKLSKEK